MVRWNVPFTQFYFFSPVFHSSIFLIYFLERRFPTLPCTSTPCALKIEARAFQRVSQHSTIELNHNVLPTFLCTLFCVPVACNSLVKACSCLMNSVPYLKGAVRLWKLFVVVLITVVAPKYSAPSSCLDSVGSLSALCLLCAGLL